MVAISWPILNSFMMGHSAITNCPARKNYFLAQADRAEIKSFRPYPAELEFVDISTYVTLQGHADLREYFYQQQQLNTLRENTAGHASWVIKGQTFNDFEAQSHDELMSQALKSGLDRSKNLYHVYVKLDQSGAENVLSIPEIGTTVIFRFHLQPYENDLRWGW